MFPTAAIAKLYPALKLLGAPLDVEGITESATPKIRDLCDAGRALLEGDGDVLKFICEAEGGMWLAVGDRHAYAVSADKVDMKPLPEAKSGSEDDGATDTSWKDAFAGKAVADETFKRVFAKLAQVKVPPTPAVETVAGGTLVKFVDESGKTLAAILTRGSVQTHYVTAALAESEELNETTELLGALEITVKKALASKDTEETHRILRRALATLATLKGRKVRIGPPEKKDEDVELLEKAKPARKSREEDDAEDTEDAEDSEDEESEEDNSEEVDAEEDDEDEGDEEMAEEIRALAAGVLVEYGDVLDTADIDSALRDRDYPRALDAVADLAEACGVDRASLLESMTTRVHKRGRRPDIKKQAGRMGKACAPKPTGQVGPGTKRGKLSEGTAADSASGTIPSGSTVTTVSVTGIPDGQADDVAALVRDANGTATDSAEGVTALFTIPENVEQFLKSLKERIPAAKAATSTAKAEESQVEWIGKVRAMPLEDFVAHIAEATTSDTLAQFSARVSALREAYKCAGGKKDIARKITAINPLVKKTTGKGISLDGVAEDHVRITMPRARVEEFEELARKLGVPASSSVSIRTSDLTITVPESYADRIKPVFAGDGITYAVVS